MAVRSSRAAFWAASIVALILAAAGPAWSQDAPPPTEPPSDAPAESPSTEAAEGEAGEPEDLVLATLALDIASSDYYALAAWARSLGLDESGTAQELRSRLYKHFGVSAPPPAASSSKTITIESADRTEYLSASDDGESTVRFEGRVSISVKDDDRGETLTIRADEIVVNRDANILSARGDIVFERRRADGSDYFVGEALELDMDDWSGAFLDGESKRAAGEESGDALFFKADDIVKRGSDVLVFKDGVVSSCDDDRPHYSIRASRIWILGGNEWAMLNATLSVGELPLLYLPFFYYPGEEIAFNPVFGYEERFGRYVQTTTYLIGRKEAKEQEISLLKIAEGGSGYERRIDGVFLRTTREPAKSKTSDFVKVIVDLYSNLGGFAAVQAQLGSPGPFSSTTAFAGLGLSRSVFSASSGYTPFVSAGDYASVWNGVDLLGSELPFRFGWELSSSLSAGPVKLSFSLPFYSDAYYNVDFRDRSEHMNWLQFLDQEDDETTASKLSTFTDSVSFSASAPSARLPSWLSTASLTKLNTSLTWNSIAKPTPTDSTEAALFAVDPTREFFAPYEWTVLDSSASLSGSLFKYPKKAAKAAATASGGAAGSAEPAAGGDGGEERSLDAVDRAVAALPSLEAPWAASDAEEKAAGSSGSAAAPGFSAPSLASPEAYADRTPLSASMSWSLSPTFAWKRRFLTSAWTEPSLVDWSALYETRTARAAGSVSLTGAAYDGLLAMTLGLSASSQAQDRPSISSDAAYASDSLRTTWAKQDAQYRNDKLSAQLKLTSSPFQDLWLWAPTTVAYSLSSTLYEYAFKEMDASYPTDASKAVYETVTADWTDETVSAHALSLDLGLQPWGYKQVLSLQADLPPLLGGYTGKLSLKAPWATLTVGTEYSMPSEDEEYAWSPLSSSLTLGEAPWPKLTGSYVWDIDDEKPTALSLQVAWNGFSASASAKEAVAYRLSYGSGWSSVGDPSFMVNAMAMAYKASWKPPAAWRRRIQWTMDVNASASQSFLRFTDSYLSFVYGLTFKAHELLDLSLSSTSKNSSLWRYFPDAFEIPEEIDLDPVNPLTDLLASFNFFDGTGDARRASLFKLKSLELTATHHLHDWDLALKLTASPVLEDLEYVFKTDFSVTLSWNSVSQIKASYAKEGETVTWN